MSGAVLVQKKTYSPLCARRDKSPGDFPGFRCSRKGKTELNKYWFYIFGAVIFEVTWVTGLKHAYNFLTWAITVIAIAACTILLMKGTKRLPVGTAYAVFAGLGTGGTVLVEMLVFHEPVTFLKIFFIGMLLTGVIGLQLITKEKEGEER